MRFLSIIILLLTVQAASAQPVAAPTPEALANAYRCAEVQDNVARLACYDEAVGRLRQAETQGQIVALDRERVATLRRESFGFSLPNFARMMPSFGGGEETLERVEMRVERIIARAYGRHSFVMSNGQTWTQVEPQSASNVRVGDAVAIRQAAMGSFMLSPEHGAGHRVRREN
jgi:hypothetical protein